MIVYYKEDESGAQYSSCRKTTVGPATKESLLSIRDLSVSLKMGKHIVIRQIKSKYKLLIIMESSNFYDSIQGCHLGLNFC